MTVLYYSPGAASLLVHWLLLELGLPHELRALDFASRQQKSPEYLALNPSGVVPTLVLDGRPMTEAAAIAMHLAERHPDAGLAPAPDAPARRDYLQWMLHLANAVQPLFRIWWYPHEPAGAELADRVRAHVQPRIEAAWERIDAQLAGAGPYLLGQAPSVADFYLTMLMRWSRAMPRPATDWPQLAALAQRMKARPSFAALYAAEGLEEWA
ncbi:glutathione S-transferase family protein [Cognatiluteimonas weifangensis]|uniref:Glutathione S-transferase n=1 Tax=Cognatiluteimonas weifangensis TaxID=2303539 RepID=A0A372DGU0_9GAMM|nr:glutathione S-transferase [Luteimonas weifangensis]RFP58043.1 glutathione S-transferase [Luteimonas weifangensis]